MGAWGSDSFDNDAACDWSYLLEESRDLSLVESTLKAAAGSEGEYLDADAGCEALAACEVVARLRGQFGARNSHTETVDNWVKSHPLRPSGELLDLARRAITRVLGKDSELRELWSDSDGAEWEAAVARLRNRLG